MGRYVVSDKAAADLTEIWSGHVERGGTVESANRLIDGFLATFEDLGDFPDIGGGRDYLPPDALAFPHNNHTLYYEKVVESVEIVQVLFGGMDLHAHFAEQG